MYYYNARYYDPHLGSFITPDPAMDGINHYAYCNANPIKYTDPTGLELEDGEEEFLDGPGVGPPDSVSGDRNGDGVVRPWEEWANNWDARRETQERTLTQELMKDSIVFQLLTGTFPVPDLTGNNRGDVSPNFEVNNIFRCKANEVSGKQVFGFSDVKKVLDNNSKLDKLLTVNGVSFENVCCHFLSLVNPLVLLGADLDLEKSLKALADNKGGFRKGQVIDKNKIETFLNAVLTKNKVNATANFTRIDKPGINYTSLISSNAALIRGGSIGHSNYQFYNGDTWYQVNSTGYLSEAGFISNPSYIGIISLNWNK